MSARPSTTATWATTTDYATSNDPAAVGQPTKEDPSSIAAQGFDYVYRPRPTHLNHWMNRIGTWVGWVKDNALGVDGGTYVLDDVIVLEAQGVTFQALAMCTVAPTGGFACASTTYAHILSGCAFTWDSGASAHFASGSNITGVANFNGTSWTFASPVVVDTTTLTLAGSGHIRIRPFNLNNTGSQTIGVNNGDVFNVPLLSGTLSITLSTTGAGTGSCMCISAHENVVSGFSAQVTTAEGTYLLRATDSGGIYCSSVDVIFRGGAWHTLRANVNP